MSQTRSPAYPESHIRFMPVFGAKHIGAETRQARQGELKTGTKRLASVVSNVLLQERSLATYGTEMALVLKSFLDFFNE